VVVTADTHGPSGVLASVTARELGVGGASCPWLVRASPGQRINVTLMDFAAYDRAPTVVTRRPRRDLHYDAGARRFCREYAVLTEQTASKNVVVKNVVVCSDDRPRSRLVYTSNSHQLQVTFTDSTPDTDDNQPYFAIKYQGCPSRVSLAHLRVHCWKVAYKRELCLLCRPRYRRQFVF